MVREVRWRRREQVGTKHDREVRHRHLVDRVARGNLVEVTHEELQRRIVRIGQLVDALVQADVSESIVFDFWQEIIS